MKSIFSKKNPNRLLIVVDMQNDFITGSLANKEAEKTVPGICDLIKEWDGEVAVTLDTHGPDYLSTAEGAKLPVEHCLKGTGGQCLESSILRTLWDRKSEYFSIEKHTFGTNEWESNYFKEFTDIVLVGTCTDICVISNAILLKTFWPNANITVVSDLCSGVTPEKHAAALEVMRSCQIDIVTKNELEDKLDLY